MTAHAKTQNLLRLSLPLTALVKNEANPNKMAAREFDLLIDNIECTGLTDPILVRPLDYEKVFEIAAKFDMPDLELVLTKEELKFRIVGGHHRFDAAAYLGLEELPVTVIMDDSFDEDQERFQLVRMNMIRGKLDPQAFFDLYNSLAARLFGRSVAGRLRFCRRGGVQEADRPDRQGAAGQEPAEEVQGGGRGDQDHRRPVEALERDVHQVRRHAALRLHGVRPWRPAVDVAGGSRARR